MTPVEETNTSEDWHAVDCATCRAICSTASNPAFPVKALELPAFTTSALALPVLICCRPSSTSCDAHALWVNTPATLVPSASSKKDKSCRSQSL